MHDKIVGNSLEKLEHNILDEFTKNELTTDGVAKVMAKIIFENNKVITDDINKQSEKCSKQFLDGLTQYAHTNRI